MRVTCPGSVGQLGLEISACDSLYHVALDPHIPSSQAGTSDFDPLNVEDGAPNVFQGGRDVPSSPAWGSPERLPFLPQILVLGLPLTCCVTWARL